VHRVRFIAAVGLTVALGVAALAYADGASDNTAYVDGSIKPKKLDPKKRTPIALFSGVRTEGSVTGSQANPEAELIEYDADGKWKSKAAPLCTADLEVPGLTADQARDLCPAKSYIGSGEAEVALNNTARISDITVSVFNGPEKNQIRLHTSSPTLGPAAPTVFGEVIKSKSPKYGPALLVADAPDAGGDAFMITKFNATIFRSSGISLFRCGNKHVYTRRTVTYDDGSQERAVTESKCKQKKR
jgi:hypothetical protein